ncbi:MAG: hypothetical protein K6D59_04495 [Bacteroidales bacterium]|nr:hypothetical protein [Bacteroidales bacterium]
MKNKFKQPSFDDVREYFEIERLETDPKVFFDYYSKNNWTWGKNKEPMLSEEDWHKAAHYFKPRIKTDVAFNEKAFNKYCSSCEKPIARDIFDKVVEMARRKGIEESYILKYSVEVVNNYIVKSEDPTLNSLHDGITIYYREHPNSPQIDFIKVYWEYVNSGNGSSPVTFAIEYLQRKFENNK